MDLYLRNLKHEIEKEVKNWGKHQVVLIEEAIAGARARAATVASGVRVRVRIRVRVGVTVNS